MANPGINTYHCGCSTLVLATSLDLQTLPRRQSPALDRATIVPLSIPVAHTSNLKYDTSFENLSSDYSPIIVRREDGFEKRILHRCARCRVVIGYDIPDQFDVKGKAVEVMYVLPGWLQTTEAMAAGKKIDGKDVVLDQGDSRAVLS